MTDTARAFLRAIVLEPRDDTSRLVYADYLDEIGEHHRAEFIRVQCALAREDRSRCDCGGEMYPLKKDSFPVLLAACIKCGKDGGLWEDVVKRKEMRERERELFFKTEIFRDIVGFDKPFGGLRLDEAGLNSCELPMKGIVHRGFISSLTCFAEDFLTHADEIVWRERSSVGCRWCGGTGVSNWKGTEPIDDCPECLRPLPDTAQPIEEVTLTALPHLDDPRMIALAHKHRYDWLPTDMPGQPNAHRFTVEIFAKEWPGIGFKMRQGDNSYYSRHNASATVRS
jgi:uncharacterized protein (TIGR02996 family)